MRAKRSHPCAKWGPQPRFAQFIFLCVREALESCPHPDSKRQARRRMRDLERHDSRAMKAAGVIRLSSPIPKAKNAVKDILGKYQEERKQQARAANMGRAYSEA